MTDRQGMREHITDILSRRLRDTDERRHEALVEFFSVTIPGMDTGRAERLAAQVPPLMPRLHERWIGMFVDRLFETVDESQLRELCAGTKAAEATVALTYVMFMESERMEKQVAADLARVGEAGDDAQVLEEALGAYLRATLAARKGDDNIQ